MFKSMCPCGRRTYSVRKECQSLHRDEVRVDGPLLISLTSTMTTIIPNVFHAVNIVSMMMTVPDPKQSSNSNVSLTTILTQTMIFP